MDDRAKYGELQMSYVTTSLLLMLHVPPVVLLGTAFDCRVQVQGVSVLIITARGC